MSWVRFHGELRTGEKRGLSRASRFIYLELSHESRPKRGVVPLPIGLSDVAAVQEILGGNRREVADAIKALTAGPDPMVHFDNIEGKRVLVVDKWDKWNPGHDDSASRVREWRAAKRNGASGGIGNALQTVSVTELKPDETGPRAPASARVRANLPLSLLGSLSSEQEIQTGSSGSTEAADSPSEVRLVPAPDRVDNASADRCSGLAVAAWCEGVCRVTGNAMSRPPRGSQLEGLVVALITHCPDDRVRVEWTRSAAIEYARAAQSSGDKLWALGFVDWLNNGRQIRGRKPKAVVQGLDGIDPNKWAKAAGSTDGDA